MPKLSEINFLFSNPILNPTPIEPYLLVFEPDLLF